MKFFTLRLLFVLAFFFSPGITGVFCSAQEPKPIEFYPIHVPSTDRISEWPFEGDEPYHAIDKKRFDRITSPQNTQLQNFENLLLQNAIQTIQLDAELRGGICLEGTGSFAIRDSVFRQQKKDEPFFIPLEPLGLWLSDPKAADGSDVRFAGIDRSVALKFAKPNTIAANDDDVEKNKTVEFRWALRGRKQGRDKLIFEFLLPIVPQSEWILRLPSQWTPTLSEGLVREFAETATTDSTTANSRGLQTAQRVWIVSPFCQTSTVLTLTSTEAAAASEPKLPIHQALTYNIHPEGLDVKSVTPLSGRTDDSEAGLPLQKNEQSRRTDFVLTLDKPLRVRSAIWGSQILSTTLINEESQSGTRQYLVSVPPGEGRLIVNAFCPLPTETKWNLPRLRLDSPQYFWMETKADLLVEEPLIVSSLETDQAVQTQAVDSPDRDVTWKGSGYSFQYFTPNSRISGEFNLTPPGLTAKTGTVILWEEDQVTGTMSLDLTPLRQSSQLVELGIQPGWSIDRESIESVPKEELLFWEGDASTMNLASPGSAEQDSDVKSLFVYLKKPTRLKLVATRLNSPARDLTFGDLQPVRILLPDQSRRIGRSEPGISGDETSGRHLLALTANSPNRLQPVAPAEQILKLIPFSDPLVRECFFPEVPPAGGSSIYALDATTRSIPIRPEQVKLRFDAKIECRLTLQEREVVQTCAFQCTPSGTRVDGFYVHFSQSSDVPWQWGISGGDRVPFCRLVPLEERQRKKVSVPDGGDLWEIRLTTPRSGTFQLTASRRMSWEKPLAVPLPTLPESAMKQVDVMVDSPYSTGVEVVNSGLKSIPIAAPAKNEYQTIRAALRYDPQRDIDGPDKPLLLLRPTPEQLVSIQPGWGETNSMKPSAWIWTLQLDSQFEPNGVIREHATFFLENRGQKRISIQLPEVVPLENVLAVWIENERVTWNPEKELNGIDGVRSVRPGAVSVSPGRSPSSEKENRSISLTLPARRRFPIVSLEYWHSSQPLTYRNKIFPSFPTIDLPVLGGTWVAWTPPEYQTFLRGKQEGLLVSDRDQGTEFGLVGEFGLSLESDPLRSPMFPRSFDPFSSDDWSSLFSLNERIAGCSPVAARFVEEIGNETNLRRLLERTTTSSMSDDSRASASSAPSLSQETTKPAPKASVITWGEVLNNHNFQEKVFSESARLESPRVFVDWIALRRIGVFPTTPIRFISDPSDRIAGHRLLEETGLSLLFFDERSLLMTSTLNAAKYEWGLRSLIGDRVKVMRDGPLANRFREAITGVAFPQWITLTAWENRTSSQIHPWGNVSPSSQIAATAVGWNALELRRSEAAHGIYIAHRPTMVALHWFAFLVCVVFSRWKPFSNLGLLAVCAIFLGGLTYSVPLYYAAIPAGAFFGCLCGIAFALIRRDVPPSRTVSPQVIRAGAGQEDSTDAEYEVRELSPFAAATGASRKKGKESFFDTLESDSDDSRR